MSFADHITALIDDNGDIEPFGTVGHEARRVLEQWSSEGTDRNEVEDPSV